MLKALTGAVIFTGNEFISGKALIIEHDRIESIIDNDSISEYAKIINCKDFVIAPGFIDLQIAGAGGYLFSANPSAEALTSITHSIIRSGTTSFLISIPTNTNEVYRKAIHTLKYHPHPAVLGLHLEGPYINPVRRGAHTEKLIRHAEKKEIETLLKEANGTIKMITVAPEMCSSEFINLVKEFGVVVCAGHSNATFNEAMTGFKRGVSSVTHIFNAMSQFHHRDPGLPGAAFRSEKIFASIIADGIHVDYNAISIAKNLMKDRLYLISDAVEENNSGSYLHVRHKDRFTLPDGILSGSALTMVKAVRNCVEHTEIPFEEALRMASLYPARVLKIDDRGMIKPGSKADLVVLNKDMKVKMVFSNGEIY
jgi:N-acetylglucosamine-6-phosphate deacetylase